MVDFARAHEIPDDGLLMTDDDGIPVFWIGGGSNAPAFNAPFNSWFFQDDGTIYRQTSAGVGNSWAVQGGSVDDNIDGGFANSVYLPDQCFDGGGA